MDQKNKKIISYFILGAIILYGFILRIYKIQEQSYWIDEAFTINAVLETIEKGHPLLDSGEYYSRSILNTYLISSSVLLFGFNEFSTRIISVIFGILSIYLIFILSKKTFNTNIALLASFMTSFSYWQIAWSRQARMYTQLQFFFFLSLYLFDSLLEKFSYKKLTFLSFSTLAAILSHYFGYFLIVIYLLTILCKIYKDKSLKNKIYQEVKKRLAAFYLFLALTIFIFYKIARDIMERIILKDNNRFLDYIYFIKDFFPVLYILAILGLIIFIFKNKKNKNKLEKAILLFVSFFVPFLTVAIVSDRILFRYIFFITPFIFIFSAYFIYFISQNTRNKKLTFTMLSILVVILTSSLNIRVFSFKPISHYYLEPLTPQSNFKEAYQKIKEDIANENKIIISPYPAMDKIYLGKSDYCLFMDLGGLTTEEERKKEKEYYTNAINIFSKNDLENIIKQNNGYIIIDYMSINDKLDQEIIDFIFKQKLIFKDEYQFNNQIWVFKF
jgi:4-amino-4-deoxy-L-arabinose transferase-like glycosyltransferase